MLDWNDYRIILAIARHNSLYRAAQELEVAVSTVMRRIAQIEGRAGLSLFHKTTDGHHPTTAGEILIAKAHQIERLTKTAAHALQSEIRAQEGVIHICASEVIAPFFVARHLPALQQACPSHHISLRVTDQSPSQMATDYDIALWPSTPSNEDLFGRQLTKLRWAMFARSAPTDGGERRAEVYQNTVHFFDRVGAEHILQAWSEPSGTGSPTVSSNSLIAAAALAASGGAAAYLPCILGAHWPGLHQLTAAEDHPVGTLWAIYQKDVALKPHVRNVLDVLVSVATQDRGMFLGAD